MKFEPYYFYYKNDSKKEPIDKVLTLDEENALTYFTGRKKMDEETFKQLYNIEKYVETESR
jgi:hypothetical protein